MAIERRIRAKIEEYRRRFDEGNYIPVFNVTGDWEQGLVLGGMDDEGKPYDVCLGYREFEILKSICEVGIGKKDIAVSLGTSEHTVKNQIRALYRKFRLPEDSFTRELFPHVLVERGFLSYEPRIPDDQKPTN